jgi:hypothetical protein
MSGLMFAAVQGAAVLHATWNALAKLVPDHRVAAGLMALAGLAGGGGGMLLLLPAPLPGSWRFLLTPLPLVSALQVT